MPIQHTVFDLITPINFIVIRLCTASVVCVYFFIKAYVVGTHLNLIDLSIQLSEYPQHMLLFVCIEVLRPSRSKTGHVKRGQFT